MNIEDEELKSEYPADLIESGVRGKYAKQHANGTNLVMIDPELHKLFPDSDAVNDALRKYATEHRLSRS